MKYSRNNSWILKCILFRESWWMFSPSPPGTWFISFSSLSSLYMLLVISYLNNQCICPSINHLCLYGTIILNNGAKIQKLWCWQLGYTRENRVACKWKMSRASPYLITGLLFSPCQCDKNIPTRVKDRAGYACP